MAPRLLMQGLWCHVETVRPDDGSCLRVDSYLREVARVAEGLKDADPLFGGEVDVTDGPVIEEQAQSILTDHGHTDDGRQIRHRPHLMGGRYGNQRLRSPGPLPIGHQLIRAHACPFSNEAKSPGLQAPSKHATVQ